MDYILDFPGLSRYLGLLITDGEPQPLKKKTAEVTETPKSTVWRVIKLDRSKKCLNTVHF
jgi:hypothetical protein